VPLGGQPGLFLAEAVAWPVTKANENIIVNLKSVKAEKVSLKMN